MVGLNCADGVFMEVESGDTRRSTAESCDCSFGGGGLISGQAARPGCDNDSRGGAGGGFTGERPSSPSSPVDGEAAVGEALSVSAVCLSASLCLSVEPSGDAHGDSEGRGAASGGRACTGGETLVSCWGGYL